MTRRHPVNNPDAAESSRQSWERFTWLSVSKECRKRGYYPDTDAYDGKGPGHAYYGALDAIQTQRSSPISSTLDVMPQQP
ncbi:hypothetical protein D6C83_04288, partial [Aureobasidium pullulans]